MDRILAFLNLVLLVVVFFIAIPICAIYDWTMTALEKLHRNYETLHERIAQ